MAKANVFLRSFIVVIMAAIVSVSFTSCEDGVLDEIEYTVKNNGGVVIPGTNTEVRTTITRDGDNGTIKAEMFEDGQFVKDTTVVVPLGGVRFEVSKNDTIVVNNNTVEHREFSISAPKTTTYDENGVTYTKSTREFVDTYDKYTKTGSISYLDAYTYVWGVRCDFPAANGDVAYNNVTTADNGADKNYNYTLATTTYDVYFMGNKSNELGYMTLATNAADELISITKTNEGFNIISFENGTGTAKSWIEITRVYAVSGAVTSRYEVILNFSVNSPAYDIKVLPSFDLNQVVAELSDESNAGVRTEGNFTISQHVQKYFVGNDVFTKTFVLSHETASWSDGNNTFDMPKACFEGIADNGFTMTDMSSTYEYDRMLNTHSISATFNGRSVNANAETEIRVTAEQDELLSKTITDEGIDYVNENTSKTWIEITEIWSVSGEKKYRKSVNLVNNLVAPASITRIVDNFDLTQNGASLGNEQLVNTHTVGDFTIQTYERNYTVSNNKFNRGFVLRYEKAIYNPMNHNMLYKEYENVSDKGFNMSDMSDVQDGANTYNRKSYIHAMSATFNGRNASAEAPAELWVVVNNGNNGDDDTTVPHWLGNPVSAKYTRVQKNTGDRFMDMIVFTYQNGVVMAPNGVVDMNLIYAFDQSVANANGVSKCSRNASYSGVWTGSKWAPAKIITNSGRWIYAGTNASWDHTVMENNAISLGIGVDVTHTPSAQSFRIDGNTITISYAVNNGRTTADTSLSLR